MISVMYVPGNEFKDIFSFKYNSILVSEVFYIYCKNWCQVATAGKYSCLYARVHYYLASNIVSLSHLALSCADKNNSTFLGGT